MKAVRPFSDDAEMLTVAQRAARLERSPWHKEPWHKDLRDCSLTESTRFLHSAQVLMRVRVNS
jgi:hypothetical protein